MNRPELVLLNGDWFPAGLVVVELGANDPHSKGRRPLTPLVLSAVSC